MANNDRMATLRSALLKKRLSGRVFISGTGRAGTTLLVQLMTELRLDTGFDPQSNFDSSTDFLGAQGSKYFSEARAGYERDPLDSSNPLIVKSPFLCDQVDLALQANIAIAHIIIPIRNLSDAAESRRLVESSSQQAPSDKPVPGGLWDTKNGESQEAILALKLARLVEAATRNQIPMTFLSFPRFARDPMYTFAKLQFLLPLMAQSTFLEAFNRCVNEELIHDFSVQNAPVQA